MSESADSQPELTKLVITPNGEIHGADTPENRELARRVHACVNACEGISTEELEANIIADMRRVLAGVVPLLEERNEQARSETDAA